MKKLHFSYKHLAPVTKEARYKAMGARVMTKEDILNRAMGIIN